jgi:CRISPR-associated endonuclease Cas1 subtype II
MTWRIVMIDSTCKLDLKLNHLVVRSEEIRRVHLSEIAVLIVENTAVSLTAALLSELVKRKIKVIFCDERRNPQCELLPYYGSVDSTEKLRRQMAWRPEIKEAVWTEIVRDKIGKQARTLEAFDLHAQAEMLRSYAEQVKPNDSSNREGHAAKVYFNALFGMDFSRSQEGDPINSCLNYGYAVLLSAFNREISVAGYVTQLGIFHDNTFNQFNLGSDLMEPFRPLVDARVREMAPTTIGPEEKRRLADVLNGKVTIGGNENFVLNAIRIYCNGVFDAIEEGDLGKMRLYE